MWGVLDRFGQVLLDGTLAMTVFMSLVVLLLLSCRQPARRVCMAQGAVLVAILMMPLVAASPLPRVNPFFWVASDPDRPIADRSLGRPGTSPAGDLDASVQGSEHDSSRVGPGTGTRAEPWLIPIIAVGYLAGALIGTTWLLIGLWGIRRLVRGSVDPGPAVQALYNELVKELGGERSAPALRVSARIHRPVLAGLIRTTIVIPQALQETEFDQGFLRLILVHELAHADQRDTISGAAANLAQCIWFFLPFLWWLRTQLRIDQEFLADQKTAIIAGSSAAYATRLVSLSTPYEGSPATRPIIESVPLLRGWWWDGGFKSPLLQRVVMLLHCPYQIETQSPDGWSALVSASMVGLGILFSCLGVSGAPTRVTTQDRASDEAQPTQPNTFRVAQFVAVARGANSSGRSVPYVLPLLLPTRFEMSLEMQATAQGLRGTRLAGLLLAARPQPEPGGEAQSAAETAESWHHVRLNRSGTSLTLTIDGTPIAVARRGDTISEWLTVEPPAEQTVVLRNLVITW
jgi:beta-lactamase regulating signal transducer with metallopeptidase domain